MINLKKKKKVLLYIEITISPEGKRERIRNRENEIHFANHTM